MLGLELRLGFVPAPTVSRFASLEFFCAWLSWVARYRGDVEETKVRYAEI